MAVAQSTNWGRIIRQGVVAGAVGAIVLHAYVYVTIVHPENGTMTSLWQWIASAAFGKVAFTSPAFIWIGLVMHLIVSMLWAGGYAFLASTRPYMNERWFLSGFFYGLVVCIFMTLIQLGANVFEWPPFLGWVNLFLACALFFGVPVALTVRLFDRP